MKKENQTVAHIAKTDINTDGRLLNEFQMIKDNFPEIDVHLILLPDKKVTIPHKGLFKLHTVNSVVRNSVVLRLFTVLEFTIRTFKILRKMKPDLVHAQDSAVSFPVLLYRLFYKRHSKFLYDDHEIPNEKQSIFNKVNTYFENTLIKKADVVLFANAERMEVLREQLRPKARLEYLLNLPFYEDKKDFCLNAQLDDMLVTLQKEIDGGMRFIIHQGPIKTQRGREKLANFSKILPVGYKILLLGGSRNHFDEFIAEYQLDANRFYFVGLVDYSILPEFWKKGAACIVMYLPTYINNRLCAPNRLYLAYQSGLPIIINKANPVLNNFINNYSCGVYIEDFTSENIYEKLNTLKTYNVEGFDKLVQKEKTKFVNIYRDLLYQN